MSRGYLALAFRFKALDEGGIGISFPHQQLKWGAPSCSRRDGERSQGGHHDFSFYLRACAEQMLLLRNNRDFRLSWVLVGEPQVPPLRYAPVDMTNSLHPKD